jgi:hypothetical protein
MFCRYCWPTNRTPIKDPNTIVPPVAGTQNIRRAATFRSNRGLAALSCLQAKPASRAVPAISRPPPKLVSPGEKTVLMPRTRAAMASVDSTPPTWSTGSLDSST